jgi:hypothetical protein
MGPPNAPGIQVNPMAAAAWQQQAVAFLHGRSDAGRGSVCGAESPFALHQLGSFVAAPFMPPAQAIPKDDSHGIGSDQRESLAASASDPFLGHLANSAEQMRVHGSSSNMHLHTGGSTNFQICQPLLRHRAAGADIAGPSIIGLCYPNGRLPQTYFLVASPPRRISAFCHTAGAPKIVRPHARAQDMQQQQAVWASSNPACLIFG